MAHLHGKNGVVKTCDEGDVGGVQTVVGARNWTYSGSGDIADTSALGDQAKTHVRGMTEGEINFDLVLDDTQDPRAANAPTLAEGSSIDFELHTDGTPHWLIDGVASVTNFEMTTPYDGEVVGRVTAKINGVVNFTYV